MKHHEWVPSTLGHGEAMCSKCFITNREAAVLGVLNECEAPELKEPQKTKLSNEQC